MDTFSSVVEECSLDKNEELSLKRFFCNWLNTPGTDINIAIEQSSESERVKHAARVYARYMGYAIPVGANT